MKKSILILMLLILACAAFAQSPVILQSDQQTYNYEDLSDFLRRYPGMYPLDYGVLGAPMLFRPWNLNPWELKVWRDGIPMNRIGDGLYDSNLQPAAELESIKYNTMQGGPAGSFLLTSRSLPVDSPYTELQIREGYYGYGTVDFAHAQRIKNSFTMQVTGRLGWFDGSRNYFLASTLSRLNRLRGDFGFNISKRWRVAATYEGSNVDAHTDILAARLSVPRSMYTEREQGILSIQEQDSTKSRYAPSLSVFVRHWESYYHSREATRGWVLRANVPVPGQRFSLRQTGMFSILDAPTVSQNNESFLELAAFDSIDVSLGELSVDGSIRRESALDTKNGEYCPPLVGGGALFRSDSWQGFSAFGGLSYSESAPPILWIKGEYLIQNRPLMINEVFSDTAAHYFAGSYDPNHVRGIDRYLKTQIGLMWKHGEAYIQPSLQILNPQGEFGNHFVVGDSTVTLEYTKEPSETQYLLSVNSAIPLIWGFQIQSAWNRQYDRNGIEKPIETRSCNRLYYERKFFKSPLIVRAHVSCDYVGYRNAYSDQGVARLYDYYLVGLRLSGTIAGVTLIWGVENFLDEFYQDRYALMPGYTMIHKEEYLGVIWRLWL
jgi:hypothetical protein